MQIWHQIPNLHKKSLLYLLKSDIMMFIWPKSKKGCYPELIEKKHQMTDEWFSSYLGTYLTKDVRTLSNIGDMRDFQRFITLLAANTSQILNMSH